MYVTPADSRWAGQDGADRDAGPAAGMADPQGPAACVWHMDVFLALLCAGSLLGGMEAKGRSTQSWMDGTFSARCRTVTPLLLALQFAAACPHPPTLAAVLCPTDTSRLHMPSSPLLPPAPHPTLRSGTSTSWTTPPSPSCRPHTSSPTTRSSCQVGQQLDKQAAAEMHAVPNLHSAYRYAADVPGPSHANSTIPGAVTPSRGKLPFGRPVALPQATGCGPSRLWCRPCGAGCRTSSSHSSCSGSRGRSSRRGPSPAAARPLCTPSSSYGCRCARVEPRVRHVVVRKRLAGSVQCVGRGRMLWRCAAVRS